MFDRHPFASHYAGGRGLTKPSGGGAARRCVYITTSYVLDCYRELYYGLHHGIGKRRSTRPLYYKSLTIISDDHVHHWPGR